MRVFDLEIERTEVLGEGGFVQIRRYRARNLREDGSRSPPYVLDVVERPAGVDAVAVLPYQHDPSGPPRVLLRRGLRPCARLGRGIEPTREGDVPAWHVVEVVSGILEPQDRGERGMRERVAEELRQEVGLDVATGAVEPLGPPVYLSVGLMAERIYFFRVECPLITFGSAEGDGTSLEEGGRIVFLPLDEAFTQCRRGELQDAKTEIAIRRLAEVSGVFPRAQDLEARES